MRDREEDAAKRPGEPETDDPVEMVNQLEKQFNALVAAYRKTDVNIFRVDTNIGGVQAKIAALRKRLGG